MKSNYHFLNYIHIFFVYNSFIYIFFLVDGLSIQYYLKYFNYKIIFYVFIFKFLKYI